MKAKARRASRFRQSTRRPTLHRDSQKLPDHDAGGDQRGTGGHPDRDAHNLTALDAANYSGTA
jgi:hypothetical protein